MFRSVRGMTLLELLIVIAIIGIVAAIGTVNGRRIAQREAAHGAVSTLQQSVWQGATAAASRGRTVDLSRSDGDLVLIDVDSGETLRTFDMPAGASLEEVDDPILRFLPPGKVDLASLEGLSDDLVLDTGEERYDLDVSLIGEVRATRVSGVAP